MPAGYADKSNDTGIKLTTQLPLESPVYPFNDNWQLFSREAVVHRPDLKADMSALSPGHAWLGLLAVGPVQLRDAKLPELRYAVRHLISSPSDGET